VNNDSDALNYGNVVSSVTAARTDADTTGQKNDRSAHLRLHD
jgi:hypothetical protein